MFMHFLYVHVRVETIEGIPYRCLPFICLYNVSLKLTEHVCVCMFVPGVKWQNQKDQHNIAQLAEPVEAAAEPAGHAERAAAANFNKKNQQSRNPPTL